MVTALALQLIQCVVKLPEPPDPEKENQEDEEQEDASKSKREKDKKKRRSRNVRLPKYLMRLVNFRMQIFTNDTYRSLPIII